MPSWLFYLNCLDWSIYNKKGVWLFFITYIAIFLEILVSNANSVGPDQTPRSAASDLGLHYLLVSL